MKVLKTQAWWMTILAICLIVPLLHADTIKFNNGSTVNGKYLGGTDSQVTFYTNGKLEHFALADISSITFGDQTSSSSTPAASVAPAAPAASSTPAPVVKESQASSQSTEQTASTNGPTADVVVPAGTHLVVRMIDGVDSNRNAVGDTFQASLQEPLIVNSTQVAPQGTWCTASWSR